MATTCAFCFRTGRAGPGPSWYPIREVVFAELLRDKGPLSVTQRRVGGAGVVVVRIYIEDSLKLSRAQPAILNSIL